MVYAISDGLNKAIPFLILPIIVQYLTPEDYGVVTNFMILVQIITIFAYGAAQGAIPVNFFKLKKEDFFFKSGAKVQQFFELRKSYCTFL